MLFNCPTDARPDPAKTLSTLAASAVLIMLTSAMGLFTAGQNAARAEASDDGYKSPYSLNFSIPIDKLTAPDNEAPRNDWHLESRTPYREWYSPAVREHFGAWGPEPRHYPAPFADYASADPIWMKQRLLAVGQKLIGLPYQHHHIPDWNPPPDWPWKEVAYGRQSPGIDCSDFTSWLYNYGLGIKLLTNVHKQAEDLNVPAPGGEGRIVAKQIDNSGNYKSMVKTLVTGDLLYIKNKEGEISHVIMWVGDVGKSPDGTPLIMDCTGSGHKDSNGVNIPVGVHLRPFTEDSWYFKSLSHAHRILGL